MDDAQDTADMAAAMGFSSFGTQKPNKRRKFNPTDDTVATTGSNMIPLGARKKNTDGIDLDDKGNENQDHIVATGQVVPRSTTGDFDEDSKSRHLDASHPSAPIVDAPADDFQSKIDAIIGGSADTHTFTSPSYPVASGGQSGQYGHRGRYRNTNPHGRAGTNWWEDYYDPSSVVNPWEALEKSNGLEPCGPWMSWEEARAARP